MSYLKVGRPPRSREYLNSHKMYPHEAGVHRLSPSSSPSPLPTPPPLKRIRTYFRRSHLHRGERYGPGQPFSGSDMTRTSNNLPCPFPSPPPVMPGGNCGIRGEIVGNWRSRAVACSGNCARANCLVSSANLPDANRPGLVCGTAGKGVAIERREG